MARDATKINYEKSYLKKKKKIEDIYEGINQPENIESQKLYCKIMGFEDEAY